MSRHSTRISHLLLGAALLGAFWAGVVALTGGFAFELDAIRLSSRGPRNPLIIAVLGGLGGWALLPAGQRRSASRRLRAAVGRALAAFAFVAQFPRAVPSLVVVAAASISAIGVQQGALVAGGSDSFGYVSQAHLWATGTLSVAQPIMSQATWPLADQSLAPPGYVPGLHGPAIVPQTPPGLPLVMSIFERLGGRHAVFYVVPLLGGLAVWLTYLMGTHLAGRAVGVSAAILLATSPVFLFQLMFPMSDVPVTAWWALSLVLLPLRRRDAALFSGLSAGVAILTRPNVVPAVLVPGAFLVWRVLAERSLTGRAMQRALLFGLGAVPACVVIAVLNTQWYGSPLKSGYGTLDYLYDWTHLWPNLSHYSLWLIETHTPVLLVALAAPFLLIAPTSGASHAHPKAMALTLLLFVVTLFSCYLFYLPMDAWWYLRFLLPAFPALLVLTSVVIVRAASRLSHGAREAAIAAVLVLLGWHGVRYASDHAAFHLREGERKYVRIGEYVASRLPERAALISMQHSGSIRYYAGRLTVRYDFIPDTSLDHVIDELRRLGYDPYIVLDTQEVSAFQERFKRHSQFAALDWPALARLQHPSATAIYDPADRQPSLQGRPRPTAIIR